MKKIWQRIAYNAMSSYYCVAFFLVVYIFFSYLYYELLPLIEGSPALTHNTDSSSGTAVTNYIDCLYFSVTTQTTIGYGDIIPASFLGKAFSMFQSVFGYTYLAFLIALFTTKGYSKIKENFQHIAGHKNRRPKKSPALSIKERLQGNTAEEG